VIELVFKAIFNENHVPKGGACLSSFVIARKGKSILVGKMAKPEMWVERFLVGPEWAPRYAASCKYLLPAQHLILGEHPSETASKIVGEMLLTKSEKPKLLGVQSHLSGDPADPDSGHWDVCFIYDARIVGKLSKPEWFSELGYVPLKSLKPGDFTRGHGDILAELGLISA
jgi:hypothetical protein